MSCPRRRRVLSFGSLLSAVQTNLNTDSLRVSQGRDWRPSIDRHVVLPSRLMKSNVASERMNSFNGTHNVLVWSNQTSRVLQCVPNWGLLVNVLWRWDVEVLPLSFRSIRTTWLCSSTTLGTKWSSEYNFGVNVSLNCWQVPDSHAVAFSRFLYSLPGCVSALMTRSRIDE